MALNNLRWLICHKTQPNQLISIIYVYKKDLALNNLQWLIYHKTQPNQIIYIIYVYKRDLALNNLQWLICHKTQPNQIIYIIYVYKRDLALNNLQWLICPKTQLNQIIYIWYTCTYKEDLASTYNGWYAIKPKQLELSFLQILSEAICLSPWANGLRKVMNTSVPHLTQQGEKVGQIGFFSFDKAIGHWERKLLFWISFTQLKIYLMSPNTHGICSILNTYYELVSQ